MSAPNTNIQTQKRRHKGPLIGLALAITFVVGLVLYWTPEDVTAKPSQPGDVEAEGLEESSQGTLADPVVPGAADAVGSAPKTAGASDLLP